MHCDGTCSTTKHHGTPFSTANELFETVSLSSSSGCGTPSVSFRSTQKSMASLALLIASGLDQLTSDELRQAKTYRPIEQRSELDRWMMSELAATCRTLLNEWTDTIVTVSCQSLHVFVDAMKNWYIRRSRSRYWAADKQSPDKLDAYWTLYEGSIRRRQTDRSIHSVSRRIALATTQGGSQGSSNIASILRDYPNGGVVTDSSVGENAEP